MLVNVIVSNQDINSANKVSLSENLNPHSIKHIFFFIEIKCVNYVSKSVQCPDIRTLILNKEYKWAEIVEQWTFSCTISVSTRSCSNHVTGVR